MRNKRGLLIQQLDRKLKLFQEAATVQVPSTGWINSIRTALNMTMAQLGSRLDITRQGVRQIEINEAGGQITINRLREVGLALDMQFVYGFVPIDGSIEKMIDSKAEELAKSIVLRTNQNMRLEDQGISDDKIKESIKDLAFEIKREMRRSLWD